MIKKSRNKQNILCYWDEELNARKVKSPLEKIEQVNLNSHCMVQFKSEYVMMWHTVGEGIRDLHYGAMLKRRGKKDGIPDWIVLIPKSGYSSLLIELKRSRKRDSTIPQCEVDFLLKAESVGAYACVAYGYVAAMKAIEDYFTNNIK